MNNTNSTVIDNFFFVFDKNENQLLVNDESNEKRILSILNFIPNQIELIQREMNIEDYFNTIISTDLTQNLFFNDLQIQVFKNFFDDLIE